MVGGTAKRKEPPVFFSHVRAFSVQRSRLSRSLEQARNLWSRYYTCPSKSGVWLIESQITGVK